MNALQLLAYVLALGALLYFAVGTAIRRMDPIEGVEWQERGAWLSATTAMLLLLSHFFLGGGA